MGMDPASWALIASAALAAGSAVDQNQTMRKQDRDAAAGIRQNMTLQQQANAKVAQTLQQQAQSNPRDAIQQQNAAYLDQLRQNQQQAQQRLLRQGLGGAYADRAAANAATENDYTNRLSGLMAQIDAPGVQRQQEQFNFGDLGTDLGVLGQNAAGNQFVTGMKVKTRNPNPWLQGLGQAAQAYASAQGGGR